MPARKTYLATGQIYHIFNRGVASSPIFTQKRDYTHFLDLMDYYQYSNITNKFSLFSQLSRKQRQKTIHELKAKNQRWVTLIAYCLMPNHFHFLIRQEAENGIREFMRLLQNSYSRYFNIKYQRHGALFGSRFKAVRVETEKQLLHLSRYIHLNPYSGYITKTLKSLSKYPYSSFREYLDNSTPQRCHKNIILSYFKNRSEYKMFVFDRADYQRSLEEIKHLLYTPGV